MKKQLLALTFLALNVTNTFANDLVVQQNGPVGTYASIGAAVTAAVDGDQIIINNRIDGLPWVENITINKSLSFLSAVDNIKFWVEGTYSVERANGRVITINGMKNTSNTGNITQVGTTIPAIRTNVNIVNSEIYGMVDFVLASNNGGVNLFLSSSIVNKEVEFTYGKIIGNELAYLYCAADPTINNDTNWVVGNNIVLNSGTYNIKYYHVNNSQFLFFSNNYIYNSFNLSSARCLDLVSLKSGTNTIINNTLFSFLGFCIASNANAQFINNVFHEYNASSYLLGSFYYNASRKALTGNLTVALGNIYVNSMALNSDGSNQNTWGTNIGSPDNNYLDLDLTRNDVGCFGGSYSLANFHPINDGKSSKVNLVRMPRVVNQGTPFNVTANGIDK